jgi:hypothetical protein
LRSTLKWKAKLKLHKSEKIAIRFRSDAYSNSNVASNNFTTFTPNSQLDLNGTLQITSGENRFFGGVATSGNAMSGSATGQFYGPNANEIGGTFGVKGSGLESMVGGFGGKR